MLDVRKYILTGIIGFFMWLFGWPKHENQTMQEMRLWHTRQEQRRKCEEELEENQKRMKQLESLAQKKQVWKAEISMLEREQTERLRAQNHCNEQKRLSDERELIMERMRELPEGNREQGLIMERMPDFHEGNREQETKPATVIPFPTAHEFSQALERAQYNFHNFHFAIAGTSGCGKSSLINAFLNLNPNDAGAAPTGVTETTLEMGRYPDPGTQPPRPWTVWYDIPGAGTQRVSDSEYFTKQALFVFDIIIVAIGNRFMETDCQIIRSCLQLNIPFFIVRSKSDQEITNMMRDKDEDYPGPFDSGEFYQKCRKQFREECQKMVTDELGRANLPNQVLHCISKRTLRDVYCGFLEQSVNLDDDCHELALVKELMKAVYQRRGGSDNSDEAVEASIPKNTFWTAGVAETIANEGNEHIHQKMQEDVVQTPPALRTLYLPLATTAQVLQIELDEQNPGLSSLLVACPQMLSPTVAILSFDPKAAIPSRIVAFRRSQTPSM